MKTKKLTQFRSPILALILFLTFTCRAQLSGVYQVPGTYTSIASVINDLNVNGVIGSVTINVAAGYTEAAPLSGFALNTIVGASASNQITFQKSGSGANPLLSAPVGTATPASGVTDGVWKFNGTDWVTINGIDIVDNNASNPATMEYGYGFFRGSATNGCQNNTIRNCVITMNRVNNAAGAGPSVEGSRGIELVNATSATHTVALTISSAGGANSNNKFYANTIQNCNIGIVLIGYADGSPFSFVDNGNDVGGASAATGNTIINFGGGGTASAAAGIRTLAQYNINVAYNNINSNNGSGVIHAQVLRGIYMNTAVNANATINSNTISIKGGGTTNLNHCIENVAGGSGTNNTISITNNLLNNCTYTTATSGITHNINTSASAFNLAITGNTLSNNSSNAASGSNYGIMNSGAVTNSITISNNLISGITFSGTSTSVLYRGIFNSAGSTATGTLTIASNTLTNITFTSTTSGEISGIYNNTALFGQNILNNVFNNLTFNSSATNNYIIYNNNSMNAGALRTVSGNSIVTGFTKTGGGTNLYGYYTFGVSNAGANEIDQNNNFSNINVSGATVLTLWQSADGTGPNKLISNNTFTNITAGTGTVTILFPGYQHATLTGTVSNNVISTVSCACLLTGVSLNSGNVNFSNNTISSFSSTGAFAVYGVNISGGGITNAFKNKVYDLQNNQAGGTVTGFSVSGGTTLNAWNNLIADLRTPAANATNPLAGISITGGTTNNFYYNTVYLNGTSSGASFGSSAISVNTTPTTIEMRNNIFVNNSTAVGTGSTVAYRRSSATLTNYSNNSNNNLFYAGTPGASNLIFSDGTAAVQTLAAFKTLMSTRDGLSVTENPTFVSTAGANANFLNINTSIATQIESGALPLAGIADDYAGVARNVNFPDIGAREGAFIPPVTDVTPPMVLASGFPTGACSTTLRTFTASLADLSGIATGALSPRVYYKVNAGAYTSAQGTLTAGTVITGVWSFDLTYAASVSDVISYYLVFQDVATTPNLVATPSAGFAGTSVNSITSDPTTPNTYNISGGLNGVYTVGAGGNYITLTAAANAYNTSCITGAVTFSLTDALYSTAETFPVVFQNNLTASATNSLLIMPATGVAVAITPTSTSIVATIKFLNAQYITIDGMNTGGSSMVINNSNVSTTSSNIWLASTASIGPGNKFVMVKNLSVVGGSKNSSQGIVAAVDGAAPSTTGGPDNDNITIQSNTVTNVYYGIAVVGAAGVSAGGADNWLITGNQVGPAVMGSNYVAGSGIVLAGVLNGTVSLNAVQNVSTTTGANYGININNSVNGFVVSQNTLNSLYTNALVADVSAIAGLYIGTNAINGTVSGNQIYRVENTNTGGYGARGMIINTGTTASNLKVYNNFVSDVVCYGDGGIGVNNVNFSPVGIGVTGCGGIDLDYNTVNLYGTHTGLSGVVFSAAFALETSANNLNVRNNIFTNTYDKTPGTNDVPYAVYSLVGNTAFTAMDRNNYYSGGVASGVLGMIGSTNRTNLSAFQAGFGLNLNAVNVLPAFNTTTDLHLTASSVANNPLDGAGLPIAGITTDIDVQARNATTPDIGADEFTSTATCTSAVGGSISATSMTICSSQTLALTSNSVSGGIGTSFAWQVAPTAGGTYTNVGIGTGTNTASYAATGLPAGTYYYVLRANCASPALTGVSNEVTVTVSGVPTPSVTMSQSVVCGSGSSTLTASGAASFLWNTGATTTSIVVTPTASGIFNVVGTNPSCPAVVSGDYNLYLSPLPIVSVSGITGICTGQTSTLQATGATTYSWNTGAITSTLSDSPTGNTTYTVTGTNALGCSSQTTQLVTVASSLSITISGPTVVCTGVQTTLTAGGGASYLWNTGANTTTIAVSPLVPTTYSVIGSSGTCSNTASKPLAVNPLPTINITGTSTICVGQTTTLTANGGSTYVWSTGGTNATLAISPVVTTTYNVVGTSSLGCVSNKTISVLSNSLPIINAATTSTAVCAGLPATLTASGGSTYTWTPALIQTTLLVNPTTTSVYTVTGTNTNNCISNKTIQIVANPLPTVSVISGSICAGNIYTLSASGASTYVYPAGTSPTVQPTIQTNYSVTGTSSLGCVSALPGVATVSVTALPVITASGGTVCANDPFVILASGGITYNFSGGNPVIPSVTTTYTVTGQSALGGCVSLPVPVTVTVSPQPTINVTSSPTLACSGQSVNLTASGASNYTWTHNGANTSATSDTPTNTTSYLVIGTSSVGCTSFTTLPLTVNPTPVVTSSPSGVFVCAGGSATLTANGALTYVWNNGPVTASNVVSPTTNTSYSVIGTNTFGCSNTAVVNVTVNTQSLTVSASTAICQGGTLTLNASGLNSYVWSGGPLPSPFSSYPVSPTSNSSYTLNGIGNGCLFSAVVNVSVNANPTLSTSISGSMICRGETATLSVTGANTYTWSEGTIGAAATVTPATNLMYNYTVTGVDANGCQNTAVVSLSVDACVGLSESQNRSLGLKVYPNPNNGAFVIELANGQTKAIEISDVTGRIVMTGASQDDRINVNLNELANGVYYVRIQTSNVSEVIRVIKQ